MKTKRLVIGYPRHLTEAVIDFPGGSVTVRCPLLNSKGQVLAYVSVDANGDRYAGDPEWWAKWGSVTRKGAACHIVRKDLPNASH